MSRPPSSAAGSTEYSFLIRESRKHRKKFLIKWCIISMTILFLSLLLIFLVVFVGIPLLFKYSSQIQRSWIFPRFNLQPTDPEFTNFDKYNLLGVRNINFTIHTESGNVVLRGWHIIPDDLIKLSLYDKDFDYEDQLARSEHPVLLYFHGTGGNRIQYVEMYRVLRKFFHVIAFDYRGYGDSTSAQPTEQTITEDSIKLYNRLHSQTRADIYLWGHGLGATVAARTAADMYKDNSAPMGLFLEAATTTLKDELRTSTFYKIFSWLPWFECTMIQPLEESGFYFRTIDYVGKVDCPIMMVHSESDEIVSFSLGEKLYNVTRNQRNLFQGTVTFHPIPLHYHYGHYQTYKLQKLPLYIYDHIINCKTYAKLNKISVEEEEPPMPEGHIYF